MMAIDDFDLYTNQVNAARRDKITASGTSISALCRRLDQEHWERQRQRWRREQRRWEILRVLAWVIAGVSLTVAVYVAFIMQ